MTLVSAPVMALLSRLIATTIAIVITVRTTAYSAIVWPVWGEAGVGVGWLGIGASWWVIG